MGGCCCCSSKGPESTNTPAYYYCPRGSEEQVPLSSHPAAVPPLSTGLLVDTNLDTSIPDTYRPPPMPLPYDVVSGHPQTPPVAQDIRDNKGDTVTQTENSSPCQVTDDINAVELSKPENTKEADCKFKTNPDNTEVDISKSAEPIASAVDEEDCPICLEEYDEENPKFITKCEHHFHLACILEWMERSETCPVCDKETVFSPPFS